MNNHFPPAVEKIVANYLERLTARLSAMPAGDAAELAGEIRSHIYESYQAEPGGDEIDRILAVLKRLGEPDEVIASHLPSAMTRLGTKRKLPLYILGGVLIALFAAPLGIGALGLLVGLLAALVGLLIGYFAAAVSLVMAGFAGALACFLSLVTPSFIQRLNEQFGVQVISWGPFAGDPVLGAVLGLIACLVLTALGLLMLYSGKFLWRGLRFVVQLLAERARRILNRRNGHSGGN
ncbi:MAG TPA: hypothetical protein PKK12_02825 [Candidatus Aminicenantes bacterium]|nr:hypothetical protein [Candidatus Aminicenantes bacterium]